MQHVFLILKDDSRSGVLLTEDPKGGLAFPGGKIEISENPKIGLAKLVEGKFGFYVHERSLAFFDRHVDDDGFEHTFFLMPDPNWNMIDNMMFYSNRDPGKFAVCTKSEAAEIMASQHHKKTLEAIIF